MKPVEFPQHNIVIAKDQPPYMPLPACKVEDPEGRVISCWKMTWCERLKTLMTGRIWITQMTFGQPLQPQRVDIDSPFRKLWLW